MIRRGLVAAEEAVVVPRRLRRDVVVPLRVRWLGVGANGSEEFNGDDVCTLYISMFYTQSIQVIAI